VGGAVVTQDEQHVGAPPDDAVRQGALPDAVAHGSPVQARRHDGAVVLVYAIIATVVFGLWRLSGDQEDVTARLPWVRSAAQVGTDGSVDVLQRISFARPRSHLTVSVPARRGPTSPFHPRIDDLRLRIDGQVASVLTSPLVEGQTRTLSFRQPTRSVVLSYSVEGAVKTAQPSAPGRALALLTPLAVHGTRDVMSRLEIDQDGVLNLGCVAPGEPMTVCGSDAGQRWVVQRAADEPVVDVVAQVDLPAASRG
jgi:hypothetical protein